MSAISFTNEQSLAIETVGGDILLTASAGTGKTAVLAERCLRLLSGGPDRCGIDELLVVTFTEAAAAEMRHRIAQRLSQELLASPNDTHLRRQLALLDKAEISTVHGFCNARVREYFYRLGLDPSYDVLDEMESILLRQQIAEDVLEDHYTLQKDGAAMGFHRLAASVGARTSDKSLSDLLLRFNAFYESNADWAQWRQACRELCVAGRQGQTHDLPLLQMHREHLLGRVTMFIQQSQQIIAHARSLPETHFYADYVSDHILCPLEDVRHLLGRGYGDKACALWPMEYKRLPNKPKHLEAALAERFKTDIGQLRDAIKKIGPDWARSGAEIMAEIGYMAPCLEALLDLHDAFRVRFDQAKRQLNAIDYSDMERFCLELLGRPGQPSDVAQELQQRYRYVLIDEYQDISPLQEAILQLVSRSGPTDPAAVADEHWRPNRFLIGDVKQSIYGFRQADPQIFLDKFNDFAPLTAAAEIAAPGRGRINLNHNFRTRRELVAAINAVFNRTMTSDTGGLDYQQQAQLHYGAAYYDTADADASPTLSEPRIEWHLIDQSQDDTATDESDEQGDTIGQRELDHVQREAYAIAQRIRHLMGMDTPDGQPRLSVYDKQTGSLRPLRFSDIVILMRSLQHAADTWVEVFQRMGIPIHADLSSGYFVATEVQDMIALLQVLDNPRQDIPLAAVLRSPVVGLDESQLLTIRRASEQGDYCDAVRAYAESGDDPMLRTRVRQFLHQVDVWRTAARRDALAEVIWRIYRETHLPAIVSGMAQGRQRYNNLLHLHDRARQFDSFARQGLSRFIRFIEQYRAQEKDLGPAPVLTEADDVVRIMSIHKSKGLEFPVVVVAALGKKFNRQDQRQILLFDRDTRCPMAMGIVDPASGDRWPSVAKSLIRARKDDELLEEEMRLLYVAMTRAREMLLMVGGARLDKLADDMAKWQEHDGPLPAYVLRSAQRPLDWLAQGWATHPAVRAWLSAPAAGTFTADVDWSLRLTVYGQADDAALQDGPLFVRRQAPERMDMLWPEQQPTAAETVCIERLIDRVEYVYPYRHLSQTPARASVTELKHRLRVDVEDGSAPDRAWSPEPTYRPPGSYQFGHRPAFLGQAGQDITPADIGSWTHLFLQHVDLGGALDGAGLAEQSRDLITAGWLTEPQVEQLDFAALARWFACPLGRQLIAHRAALYREWPFTLALPVEDGEQIMVRGVIDALFETDAGWMIVDYKTDRVADAALAERVDIYRPQIALYRQAVQSIIAAKIAGAYLYFLHAGEIVEVVDE